MSARSDACIATSLAANRDTFDMPANGRFSYLDVNNDNRLTRAELGSASNSSPFAMIDTDGDGRITLGEWPYSHRSFDEQDLNSNGAITRDEFRMGAVPASRR